MKRFLNIITKKAFVSSILFIVEMILILVFMMMLEKTFLTFWTIVYILNLITIFAVVNSDLSNAFKISWIVSLNILPGIGPVLFFFFGKKQIKKNVQSKFKRKIVSDKNNFNFRKNFKHLNINNSYLQMMQWVWNVTKQPTYDQTTTQFLSSGEIYFQNLMVDLKLAKKSIFLEFFIICPGEMWTKIENILFEKANQGLDVRLIYDDFGTLATLPQNYEHYLNKLNIKTKVFNKIKFKIDSFMNNRDHRKMVIIDNEISYTGGINLADEYINKIERFGYWQDSAIKIKGPATQNFTDLFLDMWQYLSNEPINSNNLKQTHNISLEEGLVLPFGDSPINKNRLHNTLYLKIISSAKKYIYIQTPYLIMDEQLTNALIYAAQSEIEVTIITPHIFDKFYVHTITQESYKNLIKSGVKIFEYTPGFLHSKMIISDDEVAILGTANFDYRSLYMQFENSVWMYKTKAIPQMIDHFNGILQKSKQIDKLNYKKINVAQKILNIFLKPFTTFL